MLKTLLRQNGLRLVNDAIHLPLAVHDESKNRVRGWIELTVPDPHQDREAALKAAMVDGDRYFSVGYLGVCVLVMDQACPQYPDWKASVNLDIGRTHYRIADLHIVAEMKVAAFLGEAPGRPRFAEGRNGPKFLTGAAIHLLLV